MESSQTHGRAYAAIDLDAILHNVEQVRTLIPANCGIMAVIKADGYGHGAIPIAQMLDDLPFVWGYGVATAEEGLLLREKKLYKPILILGASFVEQYDYMEARRLSGTVYSMENAVAINETMEKLGAIFPVHVKLDTGMSRLGFQALGESREKSLEEITQINRLPHIIIEGIFTHFAGADEADKASAYEQMRIFHSMCEDLKARGVAAPYYHISNSAGIIDLPEAHLDLVRLGISLYGLWPSHEVDHGRIDLRPALSLKSRITFVKELEPGRKVSYGGTYTTHGRERIATIPMGYADGLPRSLSNKGYVLIHGKKAPICGRICMDQFMVNVSHIPETKVGDEAVLIGRSGEEIITMEELSDLSGRINYEFACDLGKRVPRIYYRHGEIVMSSDIFGMSDYSQQHLA